MIFDTSHTLGGGGGGAVGVGIKENKKEITLLHSVVIQKVLAVWLLSSFDLKIIKKSYVNWFDLIQQWGHCTARSMCTSCHANKLYLAK